MMKTLKKVNKNRSNPCCYKLGEWGKARKHSPHTATNTKIAKNNKQTTKNSSHLPRCCWAIWRSQDRGNLKSQRHERKTQEAEEAKPIFRINLFSEVNRKIVNLAILHWFQYFDHRDSTLGWIIFFQLFRDRFHDSTEKLGVHKNDVCKIFDSSVNSFMVRRSFENYKNMEK